MTFVKATRLSLTFSTKDFTVDRRHWSTLGTGVACMILPILLIKSLGRTGTEEMMWATILSLRLRTLMGGRDDPSLPNSCYGGRRPFLLAGEADSAASGLYRSLLVVKKWIRIEIIRNDTAGYNCTKHTYLAHLRLANLLDSISMNDLLNCRFTSEKK